MMHGHTNIKVLHWYKYIYRASASSASSYYLFVYLSTFERVSYAYSLRDMLKNCNFVLDIFVIKTFCIAPKKLNSQFVQ